MKCQLLKHLPTRGSVLCVVWTDEESQARSHPMASASVLKTWAAPKKLSNDK